MMNSFKPRHMTDEEHEAWARAIHEACSSKWLPAMKVAFAHLMPFVAEGCDTAFTDCQYRVGLSPDLLDPEKTTTQQLAMVLVHETLHNTQKHRQRIIDRREIPGRVANFATDLEINSIIAEGICNIDLEKGPKPSNGNWDWLLGKVKVIEDQDEADKLNANINNPNKTYKVGDRYYQGGLFPRDGAFWDVPTNLTAEQYLSLIEWDEVDFDMDIQAPNCPVCGQPMNGQGQGQQQQGQGSQSGQQGSAQQGQQQQQGQGSGASGDDGDDGQAGGNGADGQQGAAGEGEGQAQGQGGQGSDGAGDGQGDGNSGGAGQGADGQGQDGASGNGHGNGTCPHCGQPLDGNGQGQGQGQGQGAGNGQGQGQGQGAGNGQGGMDQGGSIGTAHGTRTRIYQRHADGSITELGEDAWVDNIDVDPNSEAWREVGEMGINPITRGEEQHVREQLAHDIEEYRRSNQYGSGAGDMMLNYIQKGLRPPVVDWRSMLRRVVSRACQETTRGREDFTWRRISRRHSQGEFISPGQLAYLPKIRFAIDTSGSMSAKEYEKALSEAEGIIRTANHATLEAVSVDWEAYEVKKVKTVKEIVAQLRGGGGTDMAAAIKQLEDTKPQDRPDVLIVATDGCWDWDGFAQALREPCVSKTAVIVLLVYKFDEDAYYSRQGDMSEYQKLLARNKKDAYVVQAWV